MTERLCPILERATVNVATKYSRDSWKLVQCSETGFVFLPDPPDYSQLVDEMAWEKLMEEERARRRREEPFIAWTSSFTKKFRRLVFRRRNKLYSLARSVVCRNGGMKDAIRVLDIACGWGYLMEDFHLRFRSVGRKVVPVGIEISRRLAAISAERFAPLGGTVIFASALDGADQIAEGSVDIAIMSSFLEHEQQPLTLLKKLCRILVSDGSIILKVPNFNCWNRIIRGNRWCGFRYPDHVNYFTPQTLNVLAEEANLTVFRQGFLDRFPLSDNMYAILKKRV